MIGIQARGFSVWALLVWVSLLMCSAAAESSNPPGVVCHVKVVSDKVADVSSFAQWKKSYIKEGMSEQEKALAIWTSIVQHQHQDNPPNEYLQHENVVLDAMKIFNVYGYSFCGVASSHTQAFARSIGMKARGWTITNHVVPEVLVDSKWRLIDSSMLNYFWLPDKSLAGVDDIMTDVKAWYAKNPDYLHNEAKLRQFMRGANWRKNGPPIVATTSAFSDNGWSPTNCQGWYGTMEEYSGKVFNEYELGCSQGYQVNVQLREGERLTRNWSNKGLILDDDRADALNPIDSATLAYCRKLGDLSNNRIGNGTYEYRPTLASGGFRGGAMLCENLACTAEDNAKPALHAKDPAKPAVYVFRMPSSYVYLSGALTFDAIVGQGGKIAVSYSENNGLDWKPVREVTAGGPQTIDLKPLIYRRYDYRLKFELTGAGTGIDALNVTHDIQHSQRPLPALDKGSNTLSFSSDTEGTVTIEGSTSQVNKDKQVLFTDFHPTLDGVASDAFLHLSGEKGSVTVPIETPADMLRLRFGCHYRARAEQEGFDLQVSYDEGKAWKTVARAGGPGSRMDKWITVDDVPKGVRKALVRYNGNKVNDVSLFNIRIDADYAEPHSGFRPVKITYTWEENGKEKSNVHIARQANDSYTIECADKPKMKAIVLELAD
jgi:hypothetical protein